MGGRRAGLRDALRPTARFDLNPGDGTFYGPKIDVDVRTRWTAVADATSVDFQQPRALRSQ